MEVDTLAAPYVIETLDGLCDCQVSDGGCAGHAQQFLVNGPDDVPVGRIYTTEQEAEDFASDLNAAYRAGVFATDNPYVPALWRRS